MKEKELRCKRCKVLLATMGDAGLNIQRGGMRAIISSDNATAEIHCYRCSTPNVFSLDGKKACD